MSRWYKLTELSEEAKQVALREGRLYYEDPELSWDDLITLEGDKACYDEQGYC